MKASVALAVVIALLVGSGNANAETTAAAGPPLRKYIVVLREPGSAPGPSPGKPQDEPDVTKFGGQFLHGWGSRRVILLPEPALKHLREHPAVLFVQLVWSGEPLDELKRMSDSESDGRRVSAHSDANGKWETFDYKYDGSGNIRKIGSDTFEYDTAGRLIKAVVNGKTAQYSYDSFGNLLELVQQDRAAVSVAIDSASNRMNGVGIAYDAAGNLTDDGKSSRYVYDSLSMMTMAIAPLSTSPRRMLYTADDERIGVQVDYTGLTRWKIRDLGGKVVREFEGNGWLWIEDHVYANGSLVAADRPSPWGGLRHFHVDHLGSVRMITNATGAKVARHDYYPFGIEQTSFFQETTTFDYPRPDPMKFTSHERDFMGVLNAENTTYLDYMHARYYNPNWGRFLSVDPTWESADLGKPQSWNRYSYVRNNPVNATDPDGRNLALVGRIVVSSARLCAASAPCAQRALAAGVNLTGLGMSLNERFEENKAKWEEEQQNEVPDNPDDLLDKGYDETSHPDAAAKGHRSFENPTTGDKVRFDKGKEGKPKHEGRDHYHRENPNSTGKQDQYLDANGKPVPRGSEASHLYPKSWWDRLKESVRK